MARARHGFNYSDVLHKRGTSAQRRILQPVSLGVTGIMCGLDSIAVRH